MAGEWALLAQSCALCQLRRWKKRRQESAAPV